MTMKNINKILFWKNSLIILLVSGPVIVNGQIAELEDAMAMGSLIKSEEDQLIDESEVEDPRDISLKKKEEDKEQELNNKNKLEKPIDLSVRIQPKLLNNDLKKFGSDLFLDAPTTFAPATDIPIPGDYIIGPGDNIKIILYGKDSDIFTVEVTRSGEIYFPKIGPIVVAGLSFTEMKKIVEELIEQQLVGVQASINLGKLRSIKVFILGDAYQPGSYTVSALSTITNALFVSGGVNAYGSLRNIQLKRKGRTIQNFDLYDLLLNGDTSNDSRLEPGDVIFIPPSSKIVGASGEFKRPGLYELLNGEDFKDFIDIAGGLLPTADRNSGQIERILQNDGITMLDVDLAISDIAINLMDGDIVYAYPVLNKMDKVVLVSSFFSRPGFYQWTEGMKIDAIFNSYNELLPETDLNYVLIKREDPKTKEYTAIQVDLEELFANNKENSTLLNNRDEILLFNRRVVLDEVTEVTVTEANKKYDGLILDNNDQILVVKEDTVLVVDDDKIDSYESQGFKEAKQTQEFIEQTSRRNALYEGNRLELLEPFLEELRLQAKFNQLANIVSISGRVFFPGDYPFTPNMSVEALVKAGGGFKETTYLSDIEITRQIAKDKDFNITRISLTEDNLSTKLIPGDKVHIKGLSQIEKQVEIDGEVYFPGSYYLKDGETLTELVQRAGGFKPDAFLRGAIFQRESIKAAEKERFIQASNMLRQELVFASSRASELGDTNEETDLTQLMLLIEDDVDPVGRLVLDLDKIFSNNLEDLILEDNDKLVIPRKLQSVSVMGEIYVPTSHLFQPGNTANEYIAFSGGTKESADLDNIYIIKADGSVQPVRSQSSFFRSKSDFIENGDTIVVPLKTDQFSNINAVSEITQILYQIAIATAAVQSLK